jgi:flagellar biosynthetic protein FlhB
MVGSLVLLAGVIGLNEIGPAIWAAMYDVFRHNLVGLVSGEFGSSEAQEVLLRVVARMLAALAPFFGLLLAVGVSASIVQVGFQINTEKLEPNFDRLNPVAGFGRLFSTAALVRGGLIILKVIALAIVAYVVLERRGGIITGLSRDRLGGAVAAGWAVVMRLALYLVASVALVALLDYVFQRRKFEQSLRMTKQELKEEQKQEEGSPQIKIRQLQRERAKRRMLAEIPKARSYLPTRPTMPSLSATTPPGTQPQWWWHGGPGCSPCESPGSPAITLSRCWSGQPSPALCTLREGQPIPGPLFRAVAEVLAFMGFVVPTRPHRVAVEGERILFAGEDGER